MHRNIAIELQNTIHIKSTHVMYTPKDPGLTKSHVKQIDIWLDAALPSSMVSFWKSKPWRACCTIDCRTNALWYHKTICITNIKFMHMQIALRFSTICFDFSDSFLEFLSGKGSHANFNNELRELGATSKVLALSRSTSSKHEHWGFDVLVK